MCTLQDANAIKIGCSKDFSYKSIFSKVIAGKTRSYAEIAIAIGQPTAFRAVANANGANQFALIIPCHRVINTNGDLGGYGGGLTRKKWLINHEKQGM